MSYNACFSYCAFGNGEVAGCIAACTNLLEGFVVDETSSVFGDLELTFLDLLAKFPVRRKEVMLIHCISLILHGNLNVFCQ
jgi:hypothetical protein